MADWEKLAERLKAAGVKFVIEPTVRFRGLPGELRVTLGGQAETSRVRPPRRPRFGSVHCRIAAEAELDEMT